MRLKWLSLFVIVTIGAILASCATAPETTETSVLESDLELLEAGVWSSDVDPTGIVTPNTQNEEVLLSDDGDVPIRIKWELEPDLENGGSIWTWGELTCYFDEEELPMDLSAIQSIEITYSSTQPLYARWILDPPVSEGGAQHRYPMEATEGEFKTVSLDPRAFMQPSWSTIPVELNLQSMAAFQLIPILPQGGECVLELKSVKFVL